MKVYSNFYARVFRWMLRTFLRFFLDIRVHFQEPLPPGPKVFAVNHPTVWDAFPILSFVTTDYVRTLVEEQIWSFFVPRLIFTLANQIVLYRGEKSARSVEDALFLLARGDSVLIAPEGERTPPGQRVRARRGVSRLAVAGRAKVIPVGAWIDEKDIVMRKVAYKEGARRYTVDSWFPRFRASYGVVFGKPIDLRQYYGREPSLEEHQEVATWVLDRIYELEGEARKLFPSRSGV
jgi:1-acyl-sn-glycerol-3-phosphate acyltransferase